MGILKNLKAKLNPFDGKEDIPFDILFPDSFMMKYTDFYSIDEMLTKSGYKVETLEDIENIPNDGWNKYIKTTTRFKNWEDMLMLAIEEWVGRELE